MVHFKYLNILKYRNKKKSLQVIYSGDKCVLLLLQLNCWSTYNKRKKNFFDTEIVLFYLCNFMSKIYSLVYNQWCDLKKSFLIVSISFLINWCHSEDKITHMKQLTHINGSCLINQWHPSLFCLSSLSAMFQTCLEFSLILLLYV